MTEYGAATGLPLDLPPGKHPFDWYISTLIALLGERKAATYLGVGRVEVDDVVPDRRQIETRPALKEYL